MSMGAEVGSRPYGIGRPTPRPGRWGLLVALVEAGLLEVLCRRLHSETRSPPGNRQVRLHLLRETLRLRVLGMGESLRLVVLVTLLRAASSQLNVRAPVCSSASERTPSSKL